MVLSLNISSLLLDEQSSLRVEMLAALSWLVME
jgi:hypothetical protein